MYYLSQNEYLKKLFGCRVHRIVVDAGFTCPNRDGKVGVGGCIYCDEEGSRAAYCKPQFSISEQVKSGIQHIRRRFNAEKFVVYFQPFTNTYAPVETLRKIYDEGLNHLDVVGLTIGTRPDCVPDDVLDLIASYGSAGQPHRVAPTFGQPQGVAPTKSIAPQNKNYYVLLELGLQSASNKTLEQINRKHTVETFIDAVQRAKKRNIEICAHIIIGLPGESKETILESAYMLKKLGIDGVKLHSLYITKTSQFAQPYLEGKIKLLTEDEYIEIVGEYLKILGEEVVIHRLTSDVNEDTLLAPDWVRNKSEIINRIRNL